MANVNTFVNYVNEKSIHAQENSKGKAFCNVSIPSNLGITGFASIAVNAGQILPCTRKDGTVSEGYKNVLLGKPEGTHKVSYLVKKATAKRAAKYETVEMSNTAILDMINAARKAYRASQAAETETEAQG
jgi:hypothetical protein